MDNNDIRMAMLARVAAYYYDQNMTQQEIAELTGITRTVVSRMITEARDKGVVTIIVHYPWRSLRLEEALAAKFGLKAARVMAIEDETFEEMLHGLGILAADYFSKILRNQMVIGISWGSALNHMIRALNPPQLPELEVLQLIGATGSENILTDGPLLAQILASCLGATCRYLHAPLIVENRMIRDSLLQERSIRDTLLRANDADVALVGIGSVNPDLNSLMRAGYLNEPERQDLVAHGVVGDICGQHYNLGGECLDIELNHRVVGIDLKTLARIETVIGVAGDIRKGEAILGALRGKYLNVLVTDAVTAQYLLDHS